MLITFRRLPDAGDPPPAGPGELLVRPAANPAPGTRPRKAALALEKGPDGFLRGAGPVRAIVVKDDPTFDDMLAALVLDEQLAGRALPADLPLAHYAAALAEGLHPAEGLPPEDTIDGVFAHVRHAAGDPLTDPDRAARFLAGWGKLAAALRPVLADPGFDPRRRSVVTGPEFQAERLFLRADRAVYERDARAGSRWWFRLPGAPDRVAGLRLDEPKSALFKFWARFDPAAPGGDGYHFLAVRWGTADWFFSVDPLRKYDIRTLAGRLQEAEVRRDPTRVGPGGGDPDPWYDGAKHGSTIVRPPHGGTRLSEAEVWAVTRRWGRARRVLPRWAVPSALGGVAALLLAAAASAIPVRDPGRWVPGEGGRGHSPREGGTHSSDAGDRTRGPADPTEAFVRADVRPKVVNWTADLRPGVPASRPVTLDEARAGDSILAWLEAASAPRPPGGFRFAWAAGGQEVAFEPWEGSEQDWRTKPVTLRVPAGSPPAGAVVVDAGSGFAGRHDLAFCWVKRSDFHLHVMAVGVGNYDSTAGVSKLDYADRDARAAVEAFRTARNPLFTAVKAREPLVDATAAEIIDALGAFATEVKNDPAPLKLAVVLFSGHGMVYDGRFVFLPKNYAEARTSTHVSWQRIEEHLGQLGCTTLVILDACRSGEAALQAAGDSPFRSKDAVADAIKAFSAQRPGLFLLAGAAPNGQSWENKDLRHGVLTYAVLQVLEGKAPANKDGVITLHDLYDHVSKTVPDLAPKDKGVVVPAFPSGRRPDAVPIAYRPPKKKG